MGLVGEVFLDARSVEDQDADRHDLEHLVVALKGAALLCRAESCLMALCGTLRLLGLSNRGEIVLNPFLGSGSTLIAAETTGRICRGLALDPLYVNVTIRRYEAANSR